VYCVTRVNEPDVSIERKETKAVCSKREQVVTGVDAVNNADVVTVHETSVLPGSGGTLLLIVEGN